MQCAPYEDLLAPNAPCGALAIDYPHGHVIDTHRHPHAQLLYAIAGVLCVETASGRWVVPPTRGVWLQPEVDHAVRMRGDVKMRTVLIDTRELLALPQQSCVLDIPQQSCMLDIPQQSCVLDIPPLLRELIVSATGLGLNLGTALQRDSRDWHLLRLLVLELRSLPVLPLYLPLPAPGPLRAVCEALMATPDSAATVAHLAAAMGVAVRTFHRQFQAATGMRFGHWRQQARLLLALEQLACGDKVIDVALAHGYTSQSAFAATFRRHFGCVPSRFFDAGQGELSGGIGKAS